MKIKNPFINIETASRMQMFRAYALERSVHYFAVMGQTPSASDVINVAAMFDAYVGDGKTESSITAAVEEGHQEGRLEVKEAVEEWFSNVDLDDLFYTRGWLKHVDSDDSSS